MKKIEALPNRLLAFDGLRALAIFMVFNVHFVGKFISVNYYSTGLMFDVLSTLNAGHIGVDLFFILSGYLIFMSLSKVTDFDFKGFVHFFTKRAFRLIPAHAVVLGYITLRYHAELSDFFANVIFIPIFDSSYLNLNHVTWSLAYEWIFYIVISLMFLVKTKLNVEFRFSKYLDIVCLTVLSLTAAYFLDFSVARMLCFSLGSTLYVFSASGKRIPSVFNRTSTFAALCIAVAAHTAIWALYCKLMSPLEIEIYYLSVGLTWLLLTISVLNNQVGNSIFSSKILVIIGQCSYSFYLVHQTVMNECLKYIGWPTSDFEILGYLMFYFFLSFIVSYILYRIIELPIANGCRRFLSR